MGDRNYGIDPKRLSEYAKEIKKVIDKGIEVAIVIGGGNIFRGVAGARMAWIVCKEITWECWQRVSMVWLYKAH